MSRQAHAGHRWEMENSNVGIPNLPFFRSSSKHVAGSISSGVCFDSHLGLFRGTISSTKVISGD